MATKKVGTLIREARTAAGLTQEKLGKQVGLSATDISKAERGELVLTDAALKKIAKATGVTQASLLNAPKGGTSTTKKTTTKKTTSTKSTGTKSVTAASLTETEKRLILAYRSATSDQKKAATRILKGESNDLLTGILSGGSSSLSKDLSDGASDLVGNIIGGLLGNLK